MNVLEQVRNIGLVPVVRAASPDEAMQAVDAIREGGISIFEITMTVPGAVQVIEALAKRAGDDVLLGAGTVLDPDTAKACVDAGAKFIVSPALDIATIDFCRSINVPIFPGALTPTEIVTAWKAGADAVKVFPAGAVGGPTYLKSVKAPLPQIELMPTGGVNINNAKEFIAAGAIALGIGADLVDVAALRRGEAAVITEKARQYVAAVASARGAA